MTVTQAISREIQLLNVGTVRTIAGVEVTRIARNLYKIAGQRGSHFGIPATVAALMAL